MPCYEFFTQNRAAEQPPVCIHPKRTSMVRCRPQLCFRSASYARCAQGARTSQSTPASAPSTDAGSDAELASVIASHKLPAMAAVAIVEGRIGPVRVAGVLRRGSPEPVRPDDAFHLGSCTKAMTAALVGVLVDDGLLRWSSTLGELVPELAPPAWRDTTIELLLAHMAGLTALEPPGQTLNTMHAMRGPLPEQRRRWMAARLAAPPDSTRGRYSYSNAGYVVLGHLCERVTGKAWEELLAQRVWQPLQMDGAGFGPPPRVWQHSASLAARSPSQWHDNPRLMGPAGLAHMPLLAWARFVAVFAAPESQQLLSAETVQFLSTRRAERGDYAGGWIVADRGWAGGQALTHSGSNTMNYCVAWVAPRRRKAVLVATNAPNAAAACDAVCSAVLRAEDG